MAIQDKVMLLHQVDGTLRPRMFANMFDEAMEEINEHLDGYDITRTTTATGSASDMIDAYINAKKAENKSDKTLVRYRYIIERFVKAADVNIRDINTFTVRDYLAAEQTRGVQDSTVNGIREVLNAFFGWLEQEKLIMINPMRNVGPIKCQKKVREAFSDSEIEKLRRSCKNPRDMAIINFLLSTGCRISEVTQLNKDDVDLENGECTVLGKGNKQRTVYLNDIALMTLREYLALKNRSYKEPLFTGLRGERLSPNGVRIMLKALGKRAGVENVHPHRFRRTLITMLLNHDMPIQEVAIVAGHDKIDTTMKYFAASNSRIKSSYLKHVA